jgi:predicted dehydrogenase
MMSAAERAGRDGEMADDNLLKVGVVGLGPWGLEHLRAWQAIPATSVVAICDRDVELLETVAAEHGVTGRFRSAAEMAGADLDVVSIATTESLRSEAALPFIHAGVHVMVEKPLALDLPTAESLVRAAGERGVILMTGHILRFDPRFAILKQRIDEHSLGRLRSVYARRLNLRSTREKYSRTHPALMAAIHDVDLACWYLDDVPHSVRAYAPREPGPVRGEAPDVLWSVLEFSDSRLAVIENAWVLPDTGGVWLESETELLGSRGVARLRTPGDTLELLLADGPERLDPAVAASTPWHPAGALRETLLYLTECVREGRVPTRLTVADALRALAVSFAVVEAAESGEAVRPRETDCQRW